ncbi:MAG: hypothetical protein Q4F60_02970 [Candidatus Saccharibacteria bacterium]|nr:hypothetical protein [Candidatus Saccharibacteria bacterium]
MTKTKSSGFRNIIFILLLAAFCGFAILSDVIIKDLNQSIDDAVLVARDGTPASWSFTTNDKLAKLSLEGKALTSDFIQYTSSVANLTDSTIQITHLASYLETGNYSGFVNFGGNAIEYSYDISDNDSWKKIPISSPANSTDGFKLSSVVKVPPINSGENRVYFRYKVSSSGSDEISDNFAILVTDKGGTASKFTNTVTLATRVTPEVVAISDDDKTPSSDTEESYAKPLGVNSTVADTTTINSVVATTGSLATPFVSDSIKILLATLGVFAICFVGYLALNKKTSQ